MSRRKCTHLIGMNRATNSGGMTIRPRKLWLFVLLVASYMALPCPAEAQLRYGTAYSGISVGGNGTVYGWGVTDVWYTDSYHTAQITTWLYSPGWRRAVVGGGSAYNFIRADVSLPFDPGDLGTYCVSSTHSGTCTFMGNLGTAVTGACASVCPVPTNWRLTTAYDKGGGVLHMEYAWSSSIGSLANLWACTVDEKVDYPGTSPCYVWPSPPWNPNYCSPDPTIAPDPPYPGTIGVFKDDHGTFSFVTPYREDSFPATQYYRYSCSCKNNGSPVVLSGPISIVRSVTRKPDGNFKYTVTKSGYSAVIDPIQ